MVAIMSLDKISDLCKERGLYRTPELNEKLYLHFCGFKRIENLDTYSECRALWLENNCIDCIENLEALELLETLFIQHNFISSLRSPVTSELTSRPLNVRSLDISYNFLVSIEDIPLVFPQLEKLLVSHNRLKGLHSALGTMGNLLVLDVSFNEIENVEGAEEAVLGTLGGLPRLSSLMMQGNSITKIPYYRKKVIALNSALTFLDEYPVFPEERRCCTAFVDGGKAAEAKVKAELAAGQIMEKEKQLRYFADVRSSILQNLIPGKGPETTKYFIEHDDKTSQPSRHPSQAVEEEEPIHADPMANMANSTKKSKMTIVTISDDEDDEM